MHLNVCGHVCRSRKRSRAPVLHIYSTATSWCAGVQVAQQSGCKHLLLTHFSQRYPKVPELSQVAHPSMAIGFDMLTVDMDTVHDAALLVPQLRALFEQGEAAAP